MKNLDHISQLDFWRVHAPKAVIFDMDGLIFDTERLGRSCWQQAAEEYGYQISDELFSRVIGRGIDDTFSIFRAELGADFPAETIRARRLILGTQQIEQNGIDIKAGLFELLGFLKQCQILTALCTSTESSRARYYLERAGLENRFNKAVFGDQVKKAKPDPEIYRRILELLALKAEQCLVLEDSNFGVAAAHSAGIRVICIPDLVEPTIETRNNALAVVESLAHLQRALEQVKSLVGS